MYLADLNQIVENSITYNGPSSQYTQTAEKMREAGLRKIAEVRFPEVGVALGFGVQKYSPGIRQLQGIL